MSDVKPSMLRMLFGAPVPDVTNVDHDGLEVHEGEKQRWEDFLKRCGNYGVFSH